MVGKSVRDKTVEELRKLNGEEYEDALESVLETNDTIWTNDSLRDATNAVYNGATISAAKDGLKLSRSALVNHIHWMINYTKYGEKMHDAEWAAEYLGAGKYR